MPTPQGAFRLIPAGEAAATGVQSRDVAVFRDNFLVRVSFPPPGYLFRDNHLILKKKSRRPGAKGPTHRIISRVQVISMPTGTPPGDFPRVVANEASLLLVCRGEHLNDPLLWTSDAAKAAFSRMGVVDPGSFKADLRQLLVEQRLWRRRV